VPVILVFTKFDMVVPEVRGDAQQHKHARARALEMCEDSCRRIFDRDPRDVPAEIVSGTLSLSLHTLRRAVI